MRIRIVTEGASGHRTAVGDAPSTATRFPSPVARGRSESPLTYRRSENVTP